MRNCIWFVTLISVLASLSKLPLNLVLIIAQNRFDWCQMISIYQMYCLIMVLACSFRFDTAFWENHKYALNE